MKNKHMIRAGSIIFAVVILAMVLLVAACAQPAAPAPSPAPAAASQPAATAKPQVINWKGQNYYPAGFPIGHIPDGGTGISGYKWAEWIKQATRGRLVVEWTPPGSLFAVDQTLTAVSQGMVPVALAFPGAYSGTMPEAALEASVTFAVDNIPDAYIALYYYGVYEEMKKLYAERNVYLMGIFPTSGSSSVGGTFDMSSPDKLKGKKIRAVGTAADLFTMLGASVVPIPINDAYMAMKLGTIDGASSGIAALEQNKLKEVMKYYLTPGFAINNSNIMINMNAWKALPDDIREMLDRDSRRIFYEGVLELMSSENYIPAQIKEVTFQQWSPADRAKVRKQVQETLWPKLASAEVPGCKKIIDLYLQYSKDYGRS